MGNRKRKGKSNSKSFYQHRKEERRSLARLDSKEEQRPLALLDDEDNDDDQFLDWKGRQPDYILRLTLDTLMPLYQERLIADPELPQPPEPLSNSPYEEEIYFVREPITSEADYKYVSGLYLGVICSVIHSQKLYHLLWDYYSYYIEYKKTNTLSQDENAMILTNLINVFWGVCYAKKAVLVGIGDYPLNKASSNLLWIPIPDLLDKASKSDTETEGVRDELRWWYEAVISTLPFIDGSPHQQAYDTLMLPAHNRWLSVVHLWKHDPLNLERVLAQSLGKTEGVFSQADLEQLLEKIALERKWLLTPDRPVLIRLEDHPLIHQVILMQRDTYIVAKLETHEYGDWLEIVSLNDMTWLGTFRTLRNAVLGDQDKQPGKVKAIDEHLDNLAVPGLIATLVLDLVTVEDVVVAPTKRQFTSIACREEKSKPAQRKRWHWQYLPRKKYLKSSATHTQTGLSEGEGEGEGEENIIVERTELDPRQIELQTKLKRFHMVGLYTRKLPPNQKPSPAKVAQAIDLGLKLGEGETWVVAHGRGVQELKRVVEDVGLDNIPHFMKKRTGLSSS